MQITERLESANCRTDDKARRILNVAPDTVANVSADTLENGIALEALDRLNVPVFRYSTQITIHGRLPDFDANARPGGYKAVFRNGNGSVGVKYSAIDAEKKAILAQACRFSKDWGANKTSAGFQVVRYFIVRDAIRAETIACMKSVPASLFFGSVGACSLAYGAGYAVVCDIGAIPNEHVWQLVRFFSGIESPAQLVTMQAQREAEERAKREAWHAQYEQERSERAAQAEKDKAEFAAWLAALPDKRLASVPRQPGKFVRLMAERDSSGNWKRKTIEIAKRGPNLCFRLADAFSKFHTIKPHHWQRWDEAAKRGELLPA